jgi:endonuclease IV
VKQRAPSGVRIDTQHTFAAGYDISTPDGYAKTSKSSDRQVDRTIPCPNS